MVILKKFWEGWKAFGQIMGNILARIVLSIFYFTVFVPFGLGVKWLSDPLYLKPTGRARLLDDYWRPRTTGDQTLAELRRQF